MSALRLKRVSAALAVITGLMAGILMDLPATHSETIKQRPCDIYAAAKTPCVAAHSTVRSLYAKYAGALYQVKRASDDATQNIGLLSDGYANAATQDVFCTNTTCIITKIYDQSPRHNDLAVSSGGRYKGPGPNGSDLGAAADALPVTAGGHQVYGVSISPGMGYHNIRTSGIAVNGNPEGMYMVSSGTHLNSGCCFDYGNAETSGTDTGAGHMDAINVSRDLEWPNCRNESGLGLAPIWKTESSTGTNEAAILPPISAAGHVPSYRRG
jgi:non-reducing end alpha-L-arabinofuranosidase